MICENESWTMCKKEINQTEHNNEWSLKGSPVLIPNSALRRFQLSQRTVNNGGFTKRHSKIAKTDADFCSFFSSLL